MPREYIRVFQQFDSEDVEKHVLIMGDLKGDCGACRALGIDSYTARSCPECGTSFKYCTSRRVDSHPGERYQWAKRMHDTRPELILIDYSDYQKIIGRKKVRDIFG